MKVHLDVITVAVTDLERSLAFYRDGMGLPTKGIVATEYRGRRNAPAQVPWQCGMCRGDREPLHN